MANICNNELHISCANEDVSIIKKYMSDTFPSIDCYYEESLDDEDSLIEFYFDSRWDFPEKEMNDMIKLLTKPDHFFGTCLSTEWGNLYTCFHSGDNGGWYYEG